MSGNRKQNLFSLKGSMEEVGSSLATEVCDEEDDFAGGFDVDCGRERRG